MSERGEFEPEDNNNKLTADNGDMVTETIIDDKMDRVMKKHDKREDEDISSRSDEENYSDIDQDQGSPVLDSPAYSDNEGDMSEDT